MIANSVGVVYIQDDDQDGGATMVSTCVRSSPASVFKVRRLPSRPLSKRGCLQSSLIALSVLLRTLGGLYLP